MAAKESSLTNGELKRLANHEEIIERGVQSFIDVGNALAAIKQDALYTDVDKTFEGYCRKRWGFSRAHAYRYIDAAKVIEVLSPIGDISPPTNESQARVLATLPDEQTQATVWVKAVETAPKDKDGEPVVTAAHIKKVADEVSPPKPDKPEKPKPEKPAEPVDAIGTALPKKVQPAFAEAKEFEQLNRDLNEIGKRLEALAGISPFLHLQTVQADIGNIKRAVKFAKPYAVCGYCQGKGCEACKATGWLPKNIHESTPEAA